VASSDRDFFLLPFLRLLYNANCMKTGYSSLDKDSMPRSTRSHQEGVKINRLFWIGSVETVSAEN
jgi:hypothetical protein